MARCVSCGSENLPNARFCAKCGGPIKQATIPGKCPRCGSINALNMVKCGYCGAPLPEYRPDTFADAGRRNACKWCGKPAMPGDLECWDCARRLGDSSMGSIEVAASGPLLVGAILLLVAGVLALLQGVLYVFLDSIIVQMGYPSLGGMVCCGLLDILFGLGAIAGAYFAHKRTNFGLAVLGAVVGMLGLGFLVGGLLGLIALVLIASNRKDFD